MQTFLTTIILLGALGYASWRIFETFRSDGDPCKGCELRKNCQKNGQKSCHCK